MSLNTRTSVRGNCIALGRVRLANLPLILELRKEISD